MSKFVDDWRVWPHEGGRGFDVMLDDGRKVRALDTDVFGWAAFEGPDLTYVQLADGRTAFRFDTADALIEALIGVPQSAGVL